jgi:hypothetical protein
VRPYLAPTMHRAPKHYLKGIQLDKTFGLRAADARMDEAQKPAGAKPQGDGQLVPANTGSVDPNSQEGRLRKNELKAQEKRRVESARKPQAVAKTEEVTLILYPNPNPHVNPNPL